MRVIGIDPGAERCGIASLELVEGGYFYEWSDVWGLHREDGESYGNYRKRLITYWVHMPNLLEAHEEEFIVVNERLPAMHTRSQFSTQPLLSQVALACIHFWMQERGYHWREIGANTVKKAVTGNAKASKVTVRNGVITALPQLVEYKKAWPADRWDAIAIALAGAKYKV